MQSSMDQLKNNPAFAKISPLKMVFLEQILSEMQKQNNAKASQMGIAFTDEETQLIFSEMEKRLEPEERKRFQMIQSMMQNNTASQK